MCAQGVIIKADSLNFVSQLFSVITLAR